MCGVRFADPDGVPPDDQPAQVVLADVTFSSDSPYLPKDHSFVFTSDNQYFIVVPLPREAGSTEAVYRIGFTVPLSTGPPPSNPPTAYLQQHLDGFGAEQLSSDPSISPNPIYILKTIWSTRFRTHAAIADKFLVRMGNGIILLIGDAAHIHSPAGGQGMNLGIRDAISLGPMLAAHIASTGETRSKSDRLLEKYAATRRQRALTTIELTKRIMGLVRTVGWRQILTKLSLWVVRLGLKIPFVQRRAAWNLSGLGNR